MRTGPEILVVDDNADQLAIMEARLASRGYSVVTATSGEQAIALVRSSSPDLIVLDLMMPGLDGLATLRRVRQTSRVFVPVLLVSAKSGLDDIARGLEAGADDYLAKPVHPVELFARVKALLRLKDLQDALTTQAISEERTRILADIHDSVGSNITIILSLLSEASPDLPSVRRRMQKTLLELRLLIDAGTADDRIIADVIANCRHRFGDALRLAGMDVAWIIDPDVEPMSMSSSCALQIELMIAEAVSNILHHSAARRVTCEWKREGNGIVIRLEDDGCGFNHDSEHGQGLQNMRRRASRLAGGGRVDVQSRLGAGTSVCISVLDISR